MKVKLDFAERTRVSGFIPVESDRVTMRIARELREELSFSAGEVEAHNIRLNDNRVFWNPSAAGVMKEIDFSAVMLDKLFDALEKLEKEKKTTAVDIDLWDKFEFEKRVLKAVKKE